MSDGSCLCVRKSLQPGPKPVGPLRAAPAAVHGSTPVSDALATILVVVVPYICLTVFVVGHFWRYRYDKFGWTTRSSQLYESHLLPWGSALLSVASLHRLPPKPAERLGARTPRPGWDRADLKKAYGRK